jgi:hypothetical protein
MRQKWSRRWFFVQERFRGSMASQPIAWHVLGMGLPVQLVGEGVDWPAWAQAVGSVVAIGAAIWIDQGAARRLQLQEKRAREQATSDWEACLSEVRKLAANADRIAGNEQPDTFDDTLASRLIDNALMMIDAYLRQMPPSPKLAFALSAARSYLEVPRRDIRERREIPLEFLAKSPSTRVKQLERIRSSLHAASENLDALVEEYHQGVL